MSLCFIPLEANNVVEMIEDPRVGDSFLLVNTAFFRGYPRKTRNTGSHKVHNGDMMANTAVSLTR